MPNIAIAFGVVLTLIGAGFYFGTGASSPTALIPAFVGLPLLLLGVVAIRVKEGGRKHVMHAAAVLGLLGFLAPAIRLVSKGFGGAPPAVWEQVIMAVLCLVFLGLCVNSFVQARRTRGA